MVFLARLALGLCLVAGSSLIAFDNRSPSSAVAAENATLWVDTKNDDPRDPSNAVAGLDIGDDIELTLSASEPLLTNPTNLDVDDRGRIWVIDVMNYGPKYHGIREAGDRVLILEDTTGDGVIDSQKTYYQGTDIDSAMGICVLGNQLIVSASPTIWRFVDRDGDDRPDEKVAIYTDTGKPKLDHSAHSFSFGPDGKLYWNFGNDGKHVKDGEGNVVVDVHGREVVDNGRPLIGGMTFRSDLDGSNFEVLAHNFRNNYEVAVDSFGALWQSDNDDDGNRSTRLNFLIEQGNYGYRDERTRAGWREDRITLESDIPERHWHLNDPGVVPNVLLAGAGAPAGICVYEGRLLPKRFWDQLILCDPGVNMVRAHPVVPDGSGYQASTDPMATGVRDRWFRPVDVAVAPDGSLFVTDWYDPGVGGYNQADRERGRLFRIAPPGSSYRFDSPDYTTVDGAIEALRSPNLATRYSAWMSLRRMGSSAEDALRDLFSDREASDPRHRARALWLLGQLPDKAEHYVGLALADEDPDIRTTGIRMAKRLGLAPAEVCGLAATDRSAAVRRELATAIRHDESAAMPDVWAQLAERYDGTDRWYLEALGVGSDLRAAECLEAWLGRAGNDWNTPAGRDLVWRVRAPAAAEKLVAIIGAPSTSLAETDRYFRSLEFHSPSVRIPALERLIETQLENTDPTQQPDADTLIVRALERMDDFDYSNDTRLVAALARHMDRQLGTAEYVKLAARFRPDDMAEQLQEMVRSDLSRELRSKAADLLLSSDNGLQRLTKLLHSDVDSDVQAAASSLGVISKPAARQLLARLVSNPSRPFESRKHAITALANSRSSHRLLLSLMEKQRLAPDSRLLAGGLLSRSPIAEVREQVGKLQPNLQQKNRKPFAPIDQLASERGDVNRGKELFEGTATCAKCHVVEGSGKQVGPDLSEIGGKLSREALFTSILDPSAGISQNYETLIVLTTSGEIVSGIKVSESDQALVLRTSDAIDRTIAVEDIDQQRKGDASMMPDNLHELVDQQGLVDIVEYLVAQKAASH